MTVRVVIKDFSLCFLDCRLPPHCTFVECGAKGWHYVMLHVVCCLLSYKSNNMISIFIPLFIPLADPSPVSFQIQKELNLEKLQIKPCRTAKSPVTQLSSQPDS